MLLLLLDRLDRRRIFNHSLPAPLADSLISMQVDKFLGLVRGRRLGTGSLGPNRQVSRWAGHAHTRASGSVRMEAPPEETLTESVVAAFVHQQRLRDDYRTTATDTVTPASFLIRMLRYICSSLLQELCSHLASLLSFAACTFVGSITSRGGTCIHVRTRSFGLTSGGDLYALPDDFDGHQ